MEQEMMKNILSIIILAVVSFGLYMVVKDPKIEKKGHK